MPTKMNINPPQFEDVLNWLARNSEQNPKRINKLGNRSPHPYFLAWSDGRTIQLRSHPEAPHREHVLTLTEWEAFRTFRLGLSEEDRDKATSYIHRPWTLNRFFYPAVPAISRTYCVVNPE